MKITGIMPSYNLLSGQYPFVECILLALPLVDEMIINDGCSNDGTLEILKKMADIEPRIKIIQTKYEKNEQSYFSIDNGIEEMINKHSTGDWIIVFHADEFYHPKDHIRLLEAIKYCDKNGFNGIRQASIAVNYFNYMTEEPFFYNVRAFKKLPNIKSAAGADCFFFEGHPHCREGYGLHNMFPEYDMHDLICYNLPINFLTCGLIRMKRHTDFFSNNDIYRKELIESCKKRLNLKKDEDFNIDELNILSPYDYTGGFSEKLPDIFLNLSKEKKYVVREELFDILRSMSRERIQVK